MARRNETINSSLRMQGLHMENSLITFNLCILIFKFNIILIRISAGTLHRSVIMNFIFFEPRNIYIKKNNEGELVMPDSN